MQYTFMPLDGTTTYTLDLRISSHWDGTHLAIIDFLEKKSSANIKET